MPFNIVIVGTGIAGLGVVIALANKDHKVTIVEATSQLRPVGGIMVLHANANRVLDSLGVYRSLLPICTSSPHWASTRRYRDGNCLIKLPVEAHGYPLWPLHRADLQQVLFDAAVRRGVTFRLGCPVVAIVKNDYSLAAVVKGGERIDADVIMGANGIESTVRKSIIPESTCLRDSGMNIVRANILAATVRSDAETSILMDHVSLWCGPSTSIAAMPVRRGDEWLLGLDCCYTRDETSIEANGQEQNVQQFREYFKDYSLTIQKVLLYVKEAHVWKMKEAMPSSWMGKSGKVVLIGDAAHGALPWVGQGGGMALEDAVTLAECLERAHESSDIPEVLKVFEEIRQPRCRRVQEWGAIKGQRTTLPDGLEQEKRDKNFGLFNAWIKADPWDRVHVNELPELES